MKIRKRESGKWKPEPAQGCGFPLFRFSAFRFASGGFTLIELMTVIVIIGIMTAMIIPEMRGTFEDALLRSTSRSLVSVFDLASSRAVSLNQLHRVRLDSGTGQYVVERRVRSGGQEEFLPLKDVSGCTGTLDKRITIEVRRPDDVLTEPGEPLQPPPNLSEAISFYADGTADAALVTLQDRDGFRLGLKLNPITARVQIVEATHQ
jgi:type II secretion system protein H